MTSKVSCWTLLCWAILLADFPVQSSKWAAYRDFAARHIDHPRTKSSNVLTYCNLMMTRRRMTKGWCKPSHTFINGFPIHIKQICRNEGTLVDPKQNLYKSQKPFHIVTCTNTGRYPRCWYVGIRLYREISVVCKENLPVGIDLRNP